MLGDLGVSPALSLPGFVALGKSPDLRAPVSLLVNQHVTSTHHSAIVWTNWSNKITYFHFLFYYLTTSPILVPISSL